MAERRRGQMLNPAAAPAPAREKAPAPPPRPVRQSTHWETCWQVHLDCAQTRLVQLDHENRHLRVALAAIICRGREALGYEDDDGPA